MLSFISFALSLFIDGATDCASSVTAAVSSRALSIRAAAALSAICGFLGCALFSLLFPAVAKSSALVASFPRGTGGLGVCASLLAVFLWSGAAWLLSLPTSEGHGLLAAMAGSALALGGEISLSDILALLLWSFPAILLSAFLAYIPARALSKKAQNSKALRAPLILAAALSSFFHGAQDGQKFYALALSAGTLFFESKGATVLILGAFMAIGTYFGGGRIIRKMKEEIAPESLPCALWGDLAGSAALFLFTLIGAPVSTTQAKAAALAAAGAAEGKRAPLSSYLLLAVAWAATLPLCFSLSFLISKLFLGVLL